MSRSFFHLLHNTIRVDKPCCTELGVSDIPLKCAAVTALGLLPFRLWQIFSLLEVVHAAVGLVGAKVITTLLQVVSRIFIVWMIMIVVPTSPTVDMRTSFCTFTTKSTARLLALSHHVSPCCVMIA